MTIQTFMPEMEQKEPANTQVVAFYCYGKYRVKARPGLVLKGQGVTFIRTETSQTLNEYAQHRIGWNVYDVTFKALHRIAKTLNVSIEQLLD
jgi:hypothetical protein